MLPTIFTAAFLRQLEALSLRVRKAHLGTKQGSHATIRRGHGMEFADYRRYEQGDNPRQIDWGVYARSDRLYVRQFREEEDLTLLILLDASRSMFTPAEDNKWQRAIELALSFAYIGLMSGETVRLQLLGAPPSPFVSGGKGISVLGRYLEKEAAPGSSNFVADMSAAAGNLKHPGLAIVISDFLIPSLDLMAGMDLLRSRNVEVTALAVRGFHDDFPLTEGEPMAVEDAESGAQLDVAFDKKLYDQLLAVHDNELARYFERIQGRFAILKSSSDILSLVRNELPAIGVVR